MYVLSISALKNSPKAIFTSLPEWAKEQRKKA